MARLCLDYQADCVIVLAYWSCRQYCGTIKRFKFPIRTTPEGSADPYAGMATASDDIKDHRLCTEPESLGIEIPTLKK